MKMDEAEDPVNCESPPVLCLEELLVSRESRTVSDEQQEESDDTPPDLQAEDIESLPDNQSIGSSRSETITPPHLEAEDIIHHASDVSLKSSLSQQCTNIEYVTKSCQAKLQENRSDLSDSAINSKHGKENLDLTVLDEENKYLNNNVKNFVTGEKHGIDTNNQIHQIVFDILQTIIEEIDARNKETFEKERSQNIDTGNPNSLKGKDKESVRIGESFKSSNTSPNELNNCIDCIVVDGETDTELISDSESCIEVNSPHKVNDLNDGAGLTPASDANQNGKETDEDNLLTFRYEFRKEPISKPGYDEFNTVELKSSVVENSDTKEDLVSDAVNVEQTELNCYKTNHQTNKLDNKDSDLSQSICSEKSYFSSSNDFLGEFSKFVKSQDYCSSDFEVKKPSQSGTRVRSKSKSKLKKSRKHTKTKNRRATLSSIQDKISEFQTEFKSDSTDISCFTETESECTGHTNNIARGVPPKKSKPRKRQSCDVSSNESCRDSYSDFSHNLRPTKKNKKFHFINCECCQHFPKVDQNYFPVENFLRNQSDVEMLRAKVCRLFKVLFPHLEYPPNFREHTHSVEHLIDQVIDILSDQCNDVPQNESRNYIEVVLCQSPKQCLKQLCRKIVRLITALLPESSSEICKKYDFKNVSTLLDEVISSNIEAV